MICSTCMWYQDQGCCESSAFLRAAGHWSVNALPSMRTIILSHHVQGMPCEAMHAENSLWVSHQGEPSIWLLLVGQRSFLGPTIRDAHLVDILQRMHSVIRLLYGSIQRLVEMVSPDIKVVRNLVKSMTSIKRGNCSVS